jgi:cytochrome P450
MTDPRSHPSSGVGNALATEAPVLEISKVQGARSLRRDPIGLLERAATLGDVARIPMPRYEVFLVDRPDLVWDVLSTSNRRFEKSPTLRAGAGLVLGQGLLTAEGELHRQQRRAIGPIFHHERIAGYGDAMVRLTDRLAAGWRAGDVLDVHEAMQRLTLAIVVGTVFGADLGGGETSDVAAAMEEVLAQFDRQFSPWLALTKRLPLPANRRFERAVATFDRVIAGLIDERRTGGGTATGNDLLSLLLAADEEGRRMDDRQVRDEAVTLFLAGHETTANALTWTWWLLGRHPEAAVRLRAELDEVVGDRLPTAGDVGLLPWTAAVVSESLRLRPPAWAIGRSVIQEHRADGVRIARGSVVVVSPWLLHHDPRWWIDPDAFVPERWLEPDRNRPRHAFLPFGGGPRMCIGEGFARMEVVLVLATLARRWRLEPVGRGDPGLQPVITLRPRGAVPMRVAAR